MERDDKTAPVDPETILFTLDQLGQTVEVMNKVIARLRGWFSVNAEHGDCDCTTAFGASCDVAGLTGAETCAAAGKERAAA